jgi:hypothetical protein
VYEKGQLRTYAKTFKDQLDDKAKRTFLKEWYIIYGMFQSWEYKGEYFRLFLSIAAFWYNKDNDYNISNPLAKAVDALQSDQLRVTLYVEEDVNNKRFAKAKDFKWVNPEEIEDDKEFIRWLQEQYLKEVFFSWSAPKVIAPKAEVKELEAGDVEEIFTEEVPEVKQKTPATKLADKVIGEISIEDIPFS